MSLVETIRTTPTMRDFARALLFVCPELSKEAAGVLWAQFAGETGDGYHCYCWNLGNVKWFHGCGRDHMTLRGVWEGFRVGDEDKDGDVDDDDRAMLAARMLASGLWAVDPSADHARAVGPAKISLVATPLNITTWFQAFPTLDVGMAYFVSTKRTGRYATAWAFVEAGDCDGFAREIGRLGYYTASPDAYARAMLAKHKVWMASDEPPTEPKLPAPPRLPGFDVVHPRVDLPER